METNESIMFNLNGESLNKNGLKYSIESVIDNLTDSDNGTIISFINDMIPDDIDALLDSEIELNISFEKLIKIQNIINDSIARNSINKTVVMEAMYVCEDINIDIRKLSDVDTVIGLESALSEMSDKKKGIIAVAIGLLIAIIAKVISYFIGKSGDGEEVNSTDKKSAFSEAVSKTMGGVSDTVNDILNKEKDVIKDVGSIKGHDKNNLNETENKLLNAVINFSGDQDALLDKIIEEDLVKNSKSFSKFLIAMSKTNSIMKDILKNGPYTAEVIKISKTLQNSKELELNTLFNSIFEFIEKSKIINNPTDINQIKLHELTNYGNTILKNIKEYEKYINEVGDFNTELPEDTSIISPSTCLKFIRDGGLIKDQLSVNDMVNAICVVQKSIENNQQKFTKLNKDFVNADNSGTMLGVEKSLEELVTSIMQTMGNILIKRTNMSNKLNLWIVTKDSLTMNVIMSFSIYKEMFSELKKIITKLNKDNLYDGYIKSLNAAILLREKDFDKYKDNLKKYENDKKITPGDRSNMINRFKNLF